MLAAEVRWDWVTFWTCFILTAASLGIVTFVVGASWRTRLPEHTLDYRASEIQDRGPSTLTLVVTAANVTLTSVGGPR